MFDYNIFVQGFPGKSSTHGGLGWSTISLLSQNDQNIIIDVGSFGVRKLLLRRLHDKGLSPDDITMVLLTHTHWDHCVNWTLFPNATIVVGRVDMNWALNEPLGESDVPELYVKELNRSPQTRLVDHLEEVVPGIVAHQTKGHTPGHMAYSVDNGDYDLLFSGDAAKNRTELLSGNVDMTLNLSESQNSIDYLWSLWMRKTGSILVPGHDIPMKLINGKSLYLYKREADLQCWFSDTLGDYTTIVLE
ncbi:MBL fold metallo-hydrolase [Virgibacillus necropolis]|uniref:MBL fold hydrolase n=1 Tax=Virgibacillus necropolis TaxID=163877 RepID=A0A221MF84_9BACI|nr:MBL fold metallo-hydrolase [Virgibacillus necropolis]ASN06328.1 MBL fold hydrolase [Virgibacillus necropolis]